MGCTSSKDQGGGAGDRVDPFADGGYLDGGHRPSLLSLPSENGTSSVVSSMARVGSRVLRPAARGGMARATGGLEEHKASTYDHVNQIVNAGIAPPTTTNGHAAAVAARAAGRVGLANLGNTCFLNSSVQCLSNTIPLTDYFLGYDYRSEINRDNFLGTKGALASSYAEVAKHLWLGQGVQYYSPGRFKSSLAKFAPQFDGSEQHDAQELLAYLLDGIHEDLNRVKSKPYIEDDDCDGSNDDGDAIAAWSNYLRRDQSIVVDLFQGQLRSKMTCSVCGKVSVKFDSFMYLSLPVSASCSTLDDCLGLFCEEEYLSGDDAWYCPRCKCHVDATKKMDLFMLPPILIVHLKRFEFSENGRRSKIERDVSFPLSEWDLSSSKKGEGGLRPVYDLYAACHHSGTAGAGHYTATAVNRFDGRWYQFNDSSCRSVDVDVDDRGMVRGNGRRTAYCLFYNRVEGATRGGGNGARTTVIRRQSVSRPELWPHLQRDQMRAWTSVKSMDSSVPEVDYYCDEAGGDFVDDARGSNQLARISERG